MSKTLIVTDLPSLAGRPDHVYVQTPATMQQATLRLEQVALVKYTEIRFRGTSDLAVYKAAASQVYILQNTNTRDAAKWADAAFENAAILSRAQPATLLAGACRGRAVVFCAAGPSLELAYEPLKKHRESVTLVAVNTAAGALHAHGIKVDAVVAADPRPTTFLGVKDIDTSGVLLACGWFVNTQIPRRFNNIVTWTNNSPITRALYDLFGLPNTVQFTERGSVVGSALDFIDMLDPDRVFIYGQDLVIMDEFNYAKDTFYKETGRNPDIPDGEVLCNDGKTRPTSALFRTYIDTVNRCLRGWKRPVYNMSPEGARFDNTTAAESLPGRIHGRVPLSSPLTDSSLGCGPLRAWLVELRNVLACTNYPPARQSARVDAVLNKNILYTDLLFSSGFRAAVLDAKPRGKDGVIKEYLNIIQKETDAMLKRCDKVV